MVMLTILHDLSKEMGFDLVALYVDVGIDALASSRRVVESYCSELGIDLYIVDVGKALGSSVELLASKSRRDVCSVCGLVKRYVFNVFGVEKGFAIATGHHLDDVVSFTLKYVIFGGYHPLKPSSIIPAVPGASPRIRPLMKISEREVLAYALIRNVPYARNVCPYARQNPVNELMKYVFNVIEKKHPGAKLSFINRLEKEYENDLGKLRSSLCKHCGMMAQKEVCAFCSITLKAFGEAKGSQIRDLVRNLEPVKNGDG